MSDLDEARLAAWMAHAVAGFAGPITVEKFPGGQSNPTYRIDAASGRYVLRRKPFGPILPSAHAVEREYRLIAALHPTGFPVARPHGLCEDDGVIGAPFYIMELVEGRTLWDGTLPGMAPADRTAHYHAIVDTLARLHAIDYDAAGLGDYGKPGNYFERQVARWSKQYRMSETEMLPEMERLIEWLPTSVPEQERVSVVHGDYRIDNMVFHATQPKVQAVLDWELSTLGDPMADFTYLLMQWIMPGLEGLDFKALDIPTMDEAAKIYCDHAGRKEVPDLNWYYCYNLFRLTGILQGIAGRVRDGTASSAKAKESIKRTVPLAQASWKYAQLAGAK